MANERTLAPPHHPGGRRDQERRQSERLPLTIPIRVQGRDAAGKEFTEVTRTVVVNVAGARIVLKHKLLPGELLHIANLENQVEAQFRVVGPTQMAGKEAGEWGVELRDPGVSIWGVEFRMNPVDREPAGGILLECRVCGRQLLWNVSSMEVEVLNSTGIVAMDCQTCGQETYWTHADMLKQPREITASEAKAPPPRRGQQRPQVDRRKHRRVGAKLLALIRNSKDEEEVSYTENVSASGLAVALRMSLSVGDALTVICPYTRGAQNVEQKARVRWAYPFPSGPHRIYGISYES